MRWSLLARGLIPSVRRAVDLAQLAFAQHRLCMHLLAGRTTSRVTFSGFLCSFVWPAARHRGPSSLDLYR